MADQSTEQELAVTWISDARRKEIVWRVPGLIPAAMLSVLGGEQGTGKGLWCAAQAAKLTRAGHRVLWASMEDHIEYALRPRLQAAGAVLENVGRLQDFRLPTDWELVARAMNTYEPAWLIIDPVSEYMSELYSSNSDHAVRQALGPLQDIAQVYGTAITWVMHLTKGESTKALTRFAGSMGFTALARSALLLSRDPNGDDPDKRFLAHVKSNISPLADTEAWHMERVYLPAANDEPAVNTARLVHDGGATITSEQLLAQTHSTEERTEYDRACELIEETLAFGVEVPSEDLNRAAAAEGISLRTMERARRGRVESVPKGGGKARTWWVRLRVTKLDRQDRPPLMDGGLSRPHGYTANPDRAPRGGHGALSKSNLSQSPDLGTASLDDLDHHFRDTP